MSKTYRKGGYSVKINSDGSILVKPGDSLSKYSMAIHGNFNNLNEYLRKKGGLFNPIVNVNLISAGETLYHQPSIPSSGTISPILPPSLDLSDINKIIRESDLPPESYDPLTYLINTMRMGSVSISAFATFEAISTYTLLSTTINPFTGAILGIVAACYAFWKNLSYGSRMSGVRGTTYGVVGWAFDHANVPLPSATIQSLKDAFVYDEQAEIIKYKASWNQAVNMSKAKLDNYCQTENLNKEDVKAVFRAYSLSFGTGGQPRPEWLAAGLLLEVAEQHFSGNDRTKLLQPWSWYPNDVVVGRPTYPPKIQNRYPY